MKSTIATACGFGFLATLFFLGYVRVAKPGNAFRRLSKTFTEFRSAPSDEDRQRLSLRCAGQSFGLSVSLSVPFVAIVALYALSQFLIGDEAQSTLFMALATVASFATLLLLPVFRWPVSAKAQTKTGYGPFSRLLHHLALGSISVRKAMFNFELERHLKASRAPSHASDDNLRTPDVLITGMARSGTSILLRVLNECEAFSSLSYKDMPFVLAPTFWRNLTRKNQRTTETTERLHRDGLLNNQDSPEAFEEVYWETFRTDPLKDASFSNPPDQDAISRFQAYKSIVRALKSDPASRYLSKNNNSLTRLEVLARDPENSILLVYRSPISAAVSMHRTHLNFLAAFNADAFAKSYLKWLAHYEFGPLLLPFEFAKPRMQPGLSPLEPDYWLDYWCAVHEHLAALSSLPVVLINHDQLRAEPNEFLRLLGIKLGVTFTASQIAMITPVRAPENSDRFAPQLVARAESMYARLCSDPRNIVAAP
jgi:hypothetical protein